MSTPNFLYKNRCVVVTDDDYDCGNYPELGNFIGYNPSYGMSEVIVSDNLLFHKITLNCGYRQHACIDFQRKDDLDKNVHVWKNITEDFDNISYHYGFSKRGIRRFLKMEYGLALNDYRFNKITKGKDIIKAGYDLLQYFEDEEAKLCNIIIDNIKNKYGYTELKTECIGSNGEAKYKKIG